MLRINKRKTMSNVYNDYVWDVYVPELSQTPLSSITREILIIKHPKKIKLNDQLNSNSRNSWKWKRCNW